jgi:stage III sporulation protein SpoIIIAA
MIEAMAPALRESFIGFLSMLDGMSEVDTKLVTEVTVDVGRRAVVWFVDDSCARSEIEVSPDALTSCVERLLADQTFTTDNRIGITKTLHRISALRNRNNGASFIYACVFVC